MLFNDARGDGEAEAGAGFLRAEERVEEALLDFGRDAASGVGNFQDNGLGVAAVECRTAGARAERDGAFAVDGLGGVAHEVDEDLLEVRGIGGDAQVGAGFEGDLHALVFEAGRHE